MPIPAGPSPTLPTWAPTREQVAAYVPRRTLVGSVDGYGQAALTWDTTTYPTGTTVDSIILDACNWVLLATGTLDTSLESSAATCAAVRAAGWAGLTYPDNRDDLDDAKELLKQATDLRKDLAAANIALSGDDPSTSADDLLPVFSFPDAVTHGDYLL